MAVEQTIRVQALGQAWETLGVDGYGDVPPESIVASANEWGSETITFTLRRPVLIPHPQLNAFAPCEYEVGGVVVWEGRVRESPVKSGDDPQITVTGVGWQAALDDDKDDRLYVHNDLTAWPDTRSLPTTDLTVFRQWWNVSTGQGAIVIGGDQGTTAVIGTAGAVTLDLGPNPDRWAKRVVLTAAFAALGASWTFAIRGHDAEVGSNNTGGVETPLSQANPASGVKAATFTYPRRFVTILLTYTGATGALGGDSRATITAISLFGDTAYEAGNVSILKASTVIGDAVARTPALSSDLSGIVATSFNLPAYYTDGPKTRREIITAVDSYHNWRPRVRPGRVFTYDPMPNSPKYEIGDWPGSTSEDASRGSGEELYNRVLVTGNQPDGTPLYVERWTCQANPQAEDRFGIMVSSMGGVSLSAGQSSSSLTDPYAAGLLGPAAGSQLPVQRGQPYMLIVTVSNVGNLDTFTARVRIGAMDASNRLIDWAEIPITSLDQSVYTGVWVPRKDYPAWVSGQGGATGINYTIDTGGNTSNSSILADMRLVRTTLIDRRKMGGRSAELPLSMPQTPAGAARLGDVYLDNHKRTPFKGTATIAPGGAREVLGGAEPHPSELLLNTLELLRLGDEVDPDTGSAGRDGIIRNVTYTGADENAVVTIDNDRENLQALLSRMALGVKSR